MLLETLVPKAGTGKEPSSYLQPAWSCTTQGGQGNRHTHFPGKATLLAHDVLGTHDHIPLSFECSCHAQPELLKQPQQMGQNLTSWDFPCIELFGPTAVTGEPDEVGRAWEQDWGTSRRWWTPGCSQTLLRCLMLWCLLTWEIRVKRGRRVHLEIGSFIWAQGSSLLN